MSDRAPDLRVLFAGDTSFGEKYHARAEERGGVNRLLTRGYEPMLEGVSGLLASADFVIANLETPLVVPDAPSPFEGRKRHVHWADPRRTTAVLARHGVGAVSLGNNHTCDQGRDGLRSTLDALGAAGIAAFGAGLHATEAAAPLLTSLPAGDADLRLAVFGGKQRRQRRETDIQPYAGPDAGVHAWRRGDDAARIHALRQSDPGRFIVAFPHWGRNYRWRTDLQSRLARALIDAGADLVIGHGSHMLGEIECHRGRWIIYSLGNFVFGSPGRYQKVRGALPFSFAACLDARHTGRGQLSLSLRLHPLHTDNRANEYRARPVTADEMKLVREALRERSGRPEQAGWRAGADAIGPHFEIRLGTVTGPVTTQRSTRIMHGRA